MDILIFVSLGTQDKSFTRLLEQVENAINLGYIKDEVIVQAGVTNFQSKKMKIYNFLSIDEFNDYIKKCDLFITHGGVGNILSGLMKNKKIIAFSRLKRYNEHESDHQIQIVNEFEKQGYIIGLDEGENLYDKINLSKKFKFKKYKSHNKEFVNLIDEIIMQL